MKSPWQPTVRLFHNAPKTQEKWNDAKRNTNNEKNPKAANVNKPSDREPLCISQYITTRVQGYYVVTATN